MLEFDFANLPTGSEKAFVAFGEALEEHYEKQHKQDISVNIDQNGNYIGSYSSERSYVTNILAFLDEHQINSDLSDISELPNEDLGREFGRFKSRVEYITTRFRLRQYRMASGAMGTPITIPSNYKEKIGSPLNTIRKIIEQQVEESRKRDRIFAKLSELQSEIDRDQTTLDAVFGRTLDIFEVIGKGSEKIDPALERLERVRNLLFDGSRKMDILPKPDRPKAIADQSKDGPSDDLEDDDIPL